MIVGLLVSQPDDVAFVNNFLIMPMTFFGGSFFPVENLPQFAQHIVMFFPIGALNRLMRSAVWAPDLWQSVLTLLGLGLLFFGVGVAIYRRYSE